MRGEKTCRISAKVDVRGSPPHARGKVSVRPMQARGIGITPARAGKSVLVYILQCAVGDHPRACGEKLHALL